MKKTWCLALIFVMCAAFFSGCGNTGREDINVISREDGSGTRTAFIELFNILIKGDNGTRKDLTTKEAIIANKSDVMLNNIASDENAIGYGSLGALNDTVKALKIDGIEPSAKSIKDGSYQISRPFNIATNGETTGLKKDFIDFILSAKGQDVVAQSYVTVDDNPPGYAPFDGSSKKVVVAGSSSVAPIMEKLIEAYKALNPNAVIELQSSDSTSGMTGVLEGTCDIGMASRELTDNEKDKLMETTIAYDGIVLLVNKENAIDNLTSEEVRQIFIGEITSWSQLTE